MAEQDYANRKIKDMQRGIKELREKAQKGKSDIGKFKIDTQEISKRNKEFQSIINELGRKSNINEKELNEFRKQFQAERRKSMSV